MKRYIPITAVLLWCFSSYSQVGFYLGLRGGAGAMLTQEQVGGLATQQGFSNVIHSQGWTAHGKAEALVGFWRVRLGYQFMYNFGSPVIVSTPEVPAGLKTTFFNNSQTHFFGQYFLGQIEVIRTRHFDLVPGIALGTYTGFTVDNNTGEKVELSADTHRRFSMGAELNAEVIFGRWTFLFGPNYYLFSMVDNQGYDFHEYQHMIGGDVGFRVNLIKPKPR